MAGPRGLVGAALSHVVGVDVSNAVHVTRHLDVLEVLERDDDFSVRLYDEKMTATTGPFCLGMNDPARYRPEAALLQGAVRRSDADLVRRLAAEETERALSRVREQGFLDVVQDLANVVPIRVIARYYGIEGVDADELRRLLQATSKHLFAFWSDPVMSQEAVDAGHRARSLLDDAVRRQREGGSAGDGDVVGRLLTAKDRFPDGDGGIARSIAGLASGNLNAPLGLFVLAADEILSLGEAQIATARALASAAVSGSEPDRDRFRDWVREAERFCVYPPFSYRYAEEDTTLAAGTAREKRIPKGCTVVTWQSLAAFDPDVFEAPFDFVPGRPRWQYLGFGHGRHRCLGEHVGQVMIEEMMRALFALPRLRRAAGKAGTVRFLPIREGRYASSFVLEFDKVT